MKDWQNYTLGIFLGGLVIIGYFGIFWTMNLENMQFTINMDDDAKEAFLAALNQFECSPYDEPYYSCPKKLMFMNATGNYCNGTLVCENGEGANSVDGSLERDRALYKEQSEMGYKIDLIQYDIEEINNKILEIKQEIIETNK